MATKTTQVLLENAIRASDLALAAIADGAEKGARCAKLLKNVMRDLPSTDLRAEAIEAADAVLAWCAEVTR